MYVIMCNILVTFKCLSSGFLIHFYCLSYVSWLWAPKRKLFQLMLNLKIVSLYKILLVIAFWHDFKFQSYHKVCGRVGFSDSVNEVSQVVQKSQSNRVSAEVDGKLWKSCRNSVLLVLLAFSHQQWYKTFLGESAQSKRQVSPVTLDRAAILKKRFADTILKAQEKTIRKVVIPI